MSDCYRSYFESYLTGSLFSLALAWRLFCGVSAASHGATRLTRTRTDFGFLLLFFPVSYSEEKNPGGTKQGVKSRKTELKVGLCRRMADRDPVPLPAEVRAKLAELELELSEGE